MFARTRTIQADRARIEDALRVVRDELEPRMRDVEGCLAVALTASTKPSRFRTAWRSSASGSQLARSVLTTAWVVPEAMRAGDAVVATALRGAGDLFDSAAVEDWEVAALDAAQAPAPGCCGRVMRLRMDVADVDRAVGTYRTHELPQLRLIDGFRGGTLLVDRARGEGVSAVAFDGLEAMQAGRERASAIRREAPGSGHAEIVKVDEMELAVMAVYALVDTTQDARRS